MMNREERRGLVWLGIVFALLVALFIGMLGMADVASTIASSTQGRPTGVELRIGSLIGRTQDADTGRAVRSRVEILDLDAVSDHWQEDEDAELIGQFALGGLPAGRPFRVAMQADGYQPLVLSCQLDTGEELDLGNVALRPLVELSGAVLDVFGDVISHARLDLISDTQAATSGRADARGTFAWEGLAPGHYQLQVHAGALRGTSAVIADLSRGGRWRRLGQELFQTVEQPGHLELPGTRSAVILVTENERTVVEPDGSFHLRQCFAGSHWLVVEAEGLARWWVRPTLPIQSLSLQWPASREVELSPTFEGERAGQLWLAARVRGADQGWLTSAAFQGEATSPIRLSLPEGKNVDFLALDDRGRVAFRSLSRHELDGTIALTLHPPRTMRTVPAGSVLRLLPIGESDQALRIPCPEPRPIPTDLAGLVVELPGSSPLVPLSLPAPWLEHYPALLDGARRQVDGNIMRTDGRPVAGARVELLILRPEGVEAAQTTSTPAQILASTTWSRAGGDFRLEAPPREVSAVLRVQAFGLAPALHPLTQEAPRIELDEAVTLIARVEDENGTPLSGAQVSIELPAGFATNQRYSAANGEVLFRDLPAGRVGRIDVVHGERRMTQKLALQGRAGESIRAPALICYLPQFLQGQVVDQQGEPVTGARVELSFEEDHRLPAPTPLVTDTPGTFRWEGLPPPPWRLQVTAPGYLSLRRPHFQPDRRNVLLQLERLPSDS